MSISSVEDRSSVEDNEDVDPPAAKSVDWRHLLKPDYPGSDARRRVFALSASRNKSTYRKVEEAVAMMGSGDIGISISGILTWIINNYPVLDPSKLKVNVKRAVLKGLKTGRLVRTRASRKAQGVSGSFTFPAQRIKLKAVRLEGKRYVFPILQPVSSNVPYSTSVAVEVADGVKKIKTSVDDSPKRQFASSTPKRLPKSKLVSESPTDVFKKVSDVDEGEVSTTPKRLPKSKLVSESLTDIFKKVSDVDEGKVSSTPKRRSSSTPRRLPKSKLVPSQFPESNATLV